ncbi:MAG: flagellar motor switch protein FliG [Phycisphaerae bacterium]
MVAAAEAPIKAESEDISGIRKAAILLVSIDQDQASAILKKLRRELVEDVTREIAVLDNVTSELRERIVQEYWHLVMARAYARDGGISYAAELLRKTLSNDEANRIIRQIERMMYEKPFAFLQKAESENLLMFIQEEHPQTIALIVSHLAPEKASEILAALPTERQVEVVKRIANMEQTSPDVIKEIERGLESRLAGIVTDRMQKVGGVDCLANILNFVDRTTEKTILTSLEETDPEMVEQVRRLMFVFEDVLLVNDKGVQAMLKEVESADLALALRTASDELKAKIYKNMSERAGQLLKEEIDYMGPVRLSDVEAAQRKMVDIIRRLEDAGEIVIAGRGGEKDMVV